MKLLYYQYNVIKFNCDIFFKISKFKQTGAVKILFAHIETN